VTGGPPAERRGVAACGRIAALVLGQSHGFIRVTDGRKVFFHRSDVCAGASFNEFAVGDTVRFELLEDAISGARALKVERRRTRR
jgi:cold shock CspA family protein